MRVTSLRHTDLRNTELGGAILSGADLEHACLEGSDITEDQLATVHLLKGAKMPDGSIHK